MLELKAIRLQQKIGQERIGTMFTFKEAKQEYWDSVKQMVQESEGCYSVGQYLFSVKTPADEFNQSYTAEFVTSDDDSSLLDYWSAFENFGQDGSIFSIYINVLLAILGDIKRKSHENIQEFERVTFDDMTEFLSNNRHLLSERSLKYFLEDIL